MSLPDERKWLVYKCTTDDTCGQLFYTWGALKRHQSYTHHDHSTWSLSYMCSICQEEFAAASDLQSHVAIHFTGKGRNVSQAPEFTAPAKNVAADEPFLKQTAVNDTTESGCLQSVDVAPLTNVNKTPRSVPLTTSSTAKLSHEPAVPSAGISAPPNTPMKVAIMKAPSAPATTESSMKFVPLQSPKARIQKTQQATRQTETPKKTVGMKISVVVQKVPDADADADAGDQDTAQSILQHLASGGEDSQSQDPQSNRLVSSSGGAKSSKSHYSSQEELTEKEKSNLEHYPAAGGRTGIYVCKSCGQVFVSMSRFREHLSTHSDDVSVACRHCGKSFATHAALAKHAASHTQQSTRTKLSQEVNVNSNVPETAVSDQQEGSDVVPEPRTEAGNGTGSYSCPACSESFDAVYALNQHTVTHKNVTFLQCATCEQLFVTHVAFSEHFQSKCLPQKADDLVCSFCGSRFPSSAELSKHKCHKFAEAGRAAPGKYLCADCGILFKAEKPYLTHLIKHAVDKAKGVESNELECQECNLAFSSRKALSKHLQIHALKPESYPCRKCDAVYSSLRALVSHQKKHITEPYSSTFSCQFCDLTFLSRQELNLHVRTDHADLRPFACDQCDASFRAKFDLVRHKLKHEGKKFYVCQYCGRDFYAKKDLNQHEAAVHSIFPRSKPFMCHECGKVFFTRGHLNTHRRSHSNDRPFACTECPIRCKTKKNLDVHMRRHRGELPIKCGVCGMGFVDHCYLTRHMARHKPAPDLHCHLCHKAFYHQQHLKAHISTIHFICFNCDETFSSKKEVRLHRRDCSFAGAAKYLKRPGVLSTPSAVVVEPVNPGGNMLVSRSVDGSSNFADTLAPTTEPEAKDSLRSLENVDDEQPAGGAEVHPSPFGHYNADTNTVIIYEDQLRWAKNAVDPSGSGPCTYEINIPGENSGEITKLIIEDKTGDSYMDNTFGDLCVPNISQEEVVTATEKKRIKPRKAGARTRRTRKAAQKTHPDQDVSVSDKSDANPTTDPQTSVEPVMATSVEPGMTISVEPGMTTSVEPVMSTSVEPVMTTSVEPMITTSVEPVMSKSLEPVMRTSLEAVMTTSLEPVTTTLVEPVITTCTSVEPVTTVSLAEGIRKAAKKANLKDLRVVLVDVKETLQKLAGEEAAKLFAETAESMVETVIEPSCPDVLNETQPDEMLMDSPGIPEMDQSQDEGTDSDTIGLFADASAEVINSATYASVTACNRIDTLSLAAKTDETLPDPHRVASIQSSKQVQADSTLGADLKKSERVEKDKDMTSNQQAGGKTLFKCRQCQKMFVTRAGAITHACPMAGKYTSSQSMSSSGSQASTNLSVSATSFLMNSGAMVIHRPAVKSYQSDIVSSVASVSSSGQVSSTPVTVNSSSAGSSAGPRAITITSGAAAAKLLSNSVSLLSPEQRPHPQSPLSAGQTIVTAAENSSKTVLTGAAFPTPISRQIMFQTPQDVNIDQKKTQSSPSNSTMLSSTPGNIIKLASLSGTKNVTGSSAGMVKQGSSQAQASSTLHIQTQISQPGQKLQSQLSQIVKTPGLTKFKCYCCGALFPSVEAVIVHSRVHTAVSAVTGSCTATPPASTTSVAGQTTVVSSSSDNSRSFTLPIPKTAESVLISLPASNAPDKTRVIALPGKANNVIKTPLKSRSSRVTKATMSQHVDKPDTADAERKAVSTNPLDKLLHPTSPPAVLEELVSSDSAIVQSGALNRSPVDADIGTGPLSPLEDGTALPVPLGSGDHLRSDKEELLSGTTETPNYNVKNKELSKAPSEEEPHKVDDVTVISEETATGSNQTSAKNIFFQCNDCSERFATVAAFAAHAKDSHPKPRPKLQRPGRRRSTWKKHKAQWDELEQTALGDTAIKTVDTSKSVQRRKLPPRSTHKERSAQLSTEKVATERPSRGRRRANDTTKTSENGSAAAKSKELPDMGQASEPKRARMSVLELAAAAEVVEDAMWQLDRPYQCDVCDASFSNLQQTEQHLKSAHQRQEVYQCSHCVGVFSSLANLTFHFQKHAQLMAPTSVSQQQNGGRDLVGGHGEGQEQSTPRRRTRSRSSSARGRLSGTSEPIETVTTSDSHQKDKEGSRYSAGLTLESLADAAVALVERGGKMKVTSPPAIAAKTMWEASYTIHDQSFTISIAVPAPTKASHLQTDQSQVDTVESPAATLAPTAFKDNQIESTLPVESTNDSNTTSKVPMQDSHTPVKNNTPSRLEPIKTRRSSQRQTRQDEQDRVASDLHGVIHELESEREESPLDEDFSDSDKISIRSADEDDEDLPVLSLLEERKGRKTGSPCKIKTPVKSQTETPHKVLRGHPSAKRRTVHSEGPATPKNRHVLAEHLEDQYPRMSAEFSTDSRISTQRSTRKSTRRKTSLSEHGSGQRKADVRSGPPKSGIRSGNSGKQKKVAGLGRVSPRSPSSIKVAEPQQRSSSISESSFRCEVCHETFTSKALLDEHVLSHKSPQGTFSCTSCQREFRSYPYLVTHLLQHVSGLSFRCGLCTAAFNHYAALHAHQRTHSLPAHDSRGRVPCSLCGRFFASKGMLARHQKRHCLSDKPQEDSESQGSQKQTRILKESDALHKKALGLKVTQEATAQFQSKESKSDGEDDTSIEDFFSLDTNDVSDGAKSDVRGDADSEEDVIDDWVEERRQDESDSEDEKNGTQFRQASRISEDSEQNKDSSKSTAQMEQTVIEVDKQLKKTVSKQKPHCPVCERSFCNKYYLQVHMKSHDTQDEADKRPTCTKCGKTFVHEGARRSHEKRHVSGNVFKCSSCDKAYRDKHTLKQHEKTHEGKSACRYTCPVCSRLFHNLRDMEHHKAGHSTHTERIRLFVCSTCGKAFTRQTYLNMHIKRHMGPQFACTWCDKLLTSKHALEEHLRIHSGEKPFWCEICDQTFKSKVVLERHKFIHSGKYPFLCQLCGKGFTRKDSLAEHEANHTNNDSDLAMFICDVCGKVLKNKAGFVTHMQSHERHIDGAADNTEHILHKAETH